MQLTTLKAEASLYVSVCLVSKIFVGSQLVKNPPAVQETLVHILGPEDPHGEGIGYPLQYSSASLVAQLVKNLPAKWET